MQGRRVDHQVLALDGFLDRSSHGIDHAVGQSSVGVISIPVEPDDPGRALQPV